MKVKTIEYSRLFNTGNFENEKIGLTAELDEDEEEGPALRELLKKVLELHEANSMTAEEFSLMRLQASRAALKKKHIELARAKLDAVEKEVTEMLSNKIMDYNSDGADA